VAAVVLHFVIFSEKHSFVGWHWYNDTIYGAFKVQSSVLARCLSKQILGCLWLPALVMSI